MPPIRRGKAKNITLEFEAVTILEAMAPNVRAQGYLVSSLLRQEEQRRVEARRLRERLTALAAMVEVID